MRSLIAFYIFGKPTRMQFDGRSSVEKATAVERIGVTALFGIVLIAVVFGIIVLVFGRGG